MPSQLAVAPTWSGPAPATISGRLADGAVYQPRAYLTQETSVGVAESPDGAFRRVVLRTGGRVIELRRVASPALPQFEGFTASGDTLVWAESVSEAGQAVRTKLWRTNWRTGAEPVVVTSNTGEADFFGGQHDLVVRSRRVYWSAVGTSRSGETEIRSVALTGGSVSIRRLTGTYALSAWPWAVSPGGRGAPVRLLNLNDGKRIEVGTGAAETAICSPNWCRTATLEGNSVARFDVLRPDGSQRRRMAGNEATPSIADVALLDRFVPLTTDRGDAGDRVGVGLSLYDISTGHTDLVAADVANVQGRDGMLWWSTGTGDELAWHAIDLRALG